VLVASTLSGLTDAVTSVIGDYGLYAVFGLMLVDAVFPAASEVVMIYGGALASGAFAGQSVTLFGSTILSLFNSEYARQSIDVLKLLAISSFFTIIPTIYLSIKKIEKDLKKITLLSFTQSSIIVIIGYLLLLEYGIAGIGYAWIIAGIIMSLIVALLILKNDRWIKIRH
jgi:O-antigen/teichoic acid export membrane protein